ncbi:hypothetical protein K458DRAFT_163206 [Lentithecium fluviatile CBS 122367]|uniref:Uncharacterized protein n=1 Tax=Lentithecium fluviatile CBS 122367 TaxID=1168545 RepID=A0A6G1IGQ3_9PLEO|nr:hypothetical protein K458DRAFT_163206 [Lentithecium fluviatile CBS 122367]
MDIWTRIVTWKLPLFQLVSQFPRPPLGFAVESAIIAHLLGDPVDSVMSMLLTLSMCQSRAALAKETCVAANVELIDEEYERTWKGLAIILVSYDECGKSEEVAELCEEYLRLSRHPNFEGEIRHIYEETASKLAADRQTRSLPVFIAELLFIGGWLIALLRAASSEPSPTNWPQVEAHSIAFSGLYLWVTSAVVAGSVIGASQTEGSIPRMLHGFEYQLKEFRGEAPARRPSACYREETGWCKTGQERAIHGGVYSWRPIKWRDNLEMFGIGIWSLVSFVAIAVAVLYASYFPAAILSYFVPPRGLGCRHIPETLMLVVWLLSFAIECLLERWLQKKKLFWAVFWKDVLLALTNISIIIITQCGILQRCSCWTAWGLTWLHLPQLPNVKPELMHYIRHIAPAITFTAILFQFVFCAAIVWRYWDAVRVFIQRDDGISNLPLKYQKLESRRQSK